MDGLDRLSGLRAAGNVGLVGDHHEAETGRLEPPQPFGHARRDDDLLEAGRRERPRRCASRCG